MILSDQTQNQKITEKIRTFSCPSKKKGRIYMNKYSEKQIRSQRFRAFIEMKVSPKAFEYLKDCGSFLGLIANADLSRKKQVQGKSCKNRFCPFCAWKKARKDAYALSIMVKFLQIEHKKEFLFLTLTAPNVPAEELENEIKRFNAAFKKMMKRKQIEPIIKGYVRKLEVTYNKKRNDYHPHFHILIAVNKSYFTDKDYYLSREKWLNLWRQCMNDERITQVDIRKFNEDKEGNRNGKSKKKGIYEIASYSAKDEDYLHNKEVFSVFYSALKGKQTLVYSGLFKDAMKKYKVNELDEYKPTDPTKYIFYLLYGWNEKEYAELESRFLTEEEIEKWVNKKLDEVDE